MPEGVASASSLSRLIPVLPGASIVKIITLMMNDMYIKLQTGAVWRWPSTSLLCGYDLFFGDCFVEIDIVISLFHLTIMVLR